MVRWWKCRMCQKYRVNPDDVKCTGSNHCADGGVGGMSDVAQSTRRNIERYEIFGFGLWAVCLKETGEMIGDCGLTMQLINGQIRPEIGYHIRKNRQRQGDAKEAASAVRDWAFNNTPFNVVYSYMKRENTPSRKTAISYGCRQVDEFEDDENERTCVFAVTRKEWRDLKSRPVN